MFNNQSYGWIVYSVDYRDGGVLFHGVLPSKELADEEAEILHQTMSGEWYVSELPLLQWHADVPAGILHPSTLPVAEAMAQRASA